jgi:hypothetical protein
MKWSQAEEQITATYVNPREQLKRQFFGEQSLPKIFSILYQFDLLQDSDKTRQLVEYGHILGANSYNLFNEHNVQILQSQSPARFPILISIFTALGYECEADFYQGGSEKTLGNRALSQALFDKILALDSNSLIHLLAGIETLRDFEYGILLNKENINWLIMNPVHANEIAKAICLRSNAVLGNSWTFFGRESGLDNIDMNSVVAHGKIAASIVEKSIKYASNTQRKPLTREKFNEIVAECLQEQTTENLKGLSIK